MTLRRMLRAGPAAAVVVVAGWPAAATADVTVDAVLPQGDGTTALVVVLQDGCGRDATTGVTIRMPEGSAAVGATAPDGWRRSLDGDRVTFEGPGIPAGQTAEFIVTTRLGGAPGTRLALTATQRCAGGEDVESRADVALTADAVDSRMEVRVPPEVPAGAGPVEVAVAVAIFVLLAGAGARFLRRS